MARALALIALLLGTLACGVAETCPDRATCHRGTCTGRTFTSCGPCPGGSVDDLQCRARPVVVIHHDAAVPGCDNTPCLHLHRCLAGSCSGLIAYEGCCPCPATTVDVVTCLAPPDAGE